MTDGIKFALGRTSDCPSLEALTRTPQETGVQRHVETCGFCRAELALFHEFESGEPRPDELASIQWIQKELEERMGRASASHPRPSLWKRALPWLSGSFAVGRWRGLAMAAASVLIVVAAGVYFREGGAPRPPALPGALVWRSGRFTAFSPTGEITGRPADFRWETVPEAATYQIRLMEIDGTVIWNAEFHQTTAEIPNNVRAQLVPGRAFQWKVVARNAAGEQIAETNLQIFHVVVTTR